MPEQDLPHPPEDDDQEQLEYDDDNEDDENEGDDEEARPLIASVQAPAMNGAHVSAAAFSPHAQALSPYLSLPLLVAVLAPLILAALHALVLQNASLPSKVISGELDPRLFSGVDAWAHTKAMTENAHPHNSRDNDRVRAYIHSHAVRLQSIARERGVSVELADDTVNMVTQDARVYYQSNNVLLRVNPFDHREHSVPSNSTKKALLVSSHFDSQVVANGVVDNAISVAVAIELVHSVLHASHLDHPLIINFNNGEELFLLGAGAFTLHPWFSQISAFINLDGTGSAPGTRSMLFRTNSIVLTKEMKRHAPKPHASVLFNNLVSKVPSETDYRVYVGYGHLQGLDLAFYSYRYQYHTPDDSVEFSWPISAQHVLATVLGICNNPTLLESLDVVTPNLTQPILDPLPVPDFVYFDMFGAFMTVTSGRNFRLTIIWILIGCLVWAIGKSVTVSAKMGGRKFLVRYVRPTAEAFVCVLGGSIVVLGSVAILSACKSFFNQGSSYGMPIINLVWICAVVFGGLAGWVKVWPTVAEALALRKKTNASATTGRGRAVVLGQVPVGVGVGQGSSRRAGGRRGRRVLNQSSSTSPLLPSAYQVSMGPPLEKWLPYGLVAFWGTLLIPTMILSSYGYNGLFFLAHWGFYSLLAVGFTQLVSPLALKWWRQGAAASLDLAHSPQSDQSASSVAWHNRVIRFYEKQIWGVQLALASVMPAFLTLDIMGQLLISLPACIPGTPEIVNDLFFAALFVLLFANLLPAFQMSRKSYLAEAVLCVIALPFLASSMFMFPLSRIHPQQFSFEQLWNITTKSSAQFSSVDISFRYGLVTSQARVHKEFEQIDSNLLCRSTITSPKNQTEFKCTYPAIQAPSVNNSSRDPTALLKLSDNDFTRVLVDAANNVWDLRGEFEGVLGSRTCTLTVGHVNPRGDDYFVTYIDPPARGEESEWQVEGGGGRRADPMRVERDATALGVAETVILRREFGEKHGMRVPFWVRYSGGDVNTGHGIVSNLTVACYLLEAEVSEFWGRVRSEVPEWLMPGPGRYGGVKVFKTVQL
ncbi:hypothetical protein HDU77_003985 [Chytriomyces hyalinus]|nr:hypothetical protein HDU77_003985 [Chytriomyces hyalinus]